MAQSTALFKVIRVQMTRQVRDLFERSLLDLVVLFERYSPMREADLPLVMRGENENGGFLPVLQVRIVLQGKIHVRAQPSADELDAAMCALIDQCVKACEGIPIVQPLRCLVLFQPWSRGPALPRVFDSVFAANTCL